MALGHIMPSAGNIVFAVVYPHAPYAILSSMRSAHKDFILQALMETLGCEKIDELTLAGRHVDALADLVLNQQSQGPYSKYRQGQVDVNPLCRKHPLRERTCSGGMGGGDRWRLTRPSAATVARAPGPRDGDIVDEDSEEKQKRLQATDAAFGMGKQPALQRVQFEFARPLVSERLGASGSTTLHCRLRLSGTNVIGGIRALVPAGLADDPLPPHLAELHSMASSTITL